MVVGWKEQVSLSPESVAEICGRTTATGLDPAQVQQFANELGLTYENPACYTVDGFRDLLGRSGPLWVAAIVPGLHAIVVTGLYSDGTNTYVRVTDPWDRVAGRPGAPGKYLKTHATGSRYILTWEDFLSEYEGAAMTYDQVNLQILHSGGTGGRTPNRGKPAGYAQSLAARVRASRAGRSPQMAAARAQTGENGATATSAVPRREAGAWNGVSWQLDQFDGFLLPSGARAAEAPPGVADRTVSLSDWPFVPAGDTRTLLPLTVTWRHGGGAVGDVRISPGTAEASPGWALRVTGDIAGVPGTADVAALRVTLRHTFSG